MSDEIPWLPKITAFPKGVPRVESTVPEAVRKLIEQRAKDTEEMVLAMLSVKKPEWEIVRIQSEQIPGVAFVRKDHLFLPSCMEPVKEEQYVQAKTKADIGTRIRNFKFEEDNMSENINDPVNHPSHYTDGPTLGRLECLDITRWLPFGLGNAFKYVWRAGKKDSAKIIEDLEKARFYLLDWKELQTWQRTLYHGRAPAEMMLFKADCKQFASWRYQTLRAIVRGDADEAIDVIDRQITAERVGFRAAGDVDDNFVHGYQPEDETYDD